MHMRLERGAIEQSLPALDSQPNPAGVDGFDIDKQRVSASNPEIQPPGLGGPDALEARLQIVRAEMLVRHDRRPTPGNKKPRRSGAFTTGFTRPSELVGRRL